jgi:hypothetical protein
MWREEYQAVATRIGLSQVLFAMDCAHPFISQALGGQLEGRPYL